MRTEIKTLTFCKFEELTATQQSSVIAKNYYINVSHDWWDSDEEDFINILTYLGYYNIETRFSGFSSQGDGASFKAKFRIPTKEDSMNERIKKLQTYAPKLLKRIDIITELSDLQYLLSGYHDDLEITYNNSRYCHSYTMDCDNSHLGKVSQLLARYYYISLNEYYDYLTSDDAIKEALIANDYEIELESLEIA